MSDVAAYASLHMSLHMSAVLCRSLSTYASLAVFGTKSNEIQRFPEDFFCDFYAGATPLVPYILSHATCHI